MILCLDGVSDALLRCFIFFVEISRCVCVRPSWKCVFLKDYDVCFITCRQLLSGIGSCAGWDWTRRAAYIHAVILPYAVRLWHAYLIFNKNFSLAWGDCYFVSAPSVPSFCSCCLLFSSFG